jgi:hypothetical protein
MVLFLGGLFLGLWAFREDNVRPMVTMGAALKACILAAVFLASPLVAARLGTLGGAKLRADLEEVRGDGYPDEYRIVAALALRHPAALFVLMWFFVALGLGYGTFGAGALLDRARFTPEGSVVCTVVGTRREEQRTRLSLTCRFPSRTEKVRLLRMEGAPRVDVGGTIALPLARGVLGSTWLDGTQEVPAEER